MVAMEIHTKAVALRTERISTYETFVVDQNRRRAGFELPINFEGKPARLGEHGEDYKSFAVGSGLGLSVQSVPWLFRITATQRSVHLLLHMFYFFSLLLKSALGIGESIFVRFHCLRNQFHDRLHVRIRVGVLRHHAGFHQKFQRICEAICKRPLNFNVDFLRLQLIRNSRKSFHDLVGIRCGKTGFQTRRHLGAQRAIVFCGRRDQSIFQIRWKPEVGLNIFSSHRCIIQAKCLHATKHSATFLTKQSATQEEKA